MKRSALGRWVVLVLLGSMGAFGAFVQHNRHANLAYSPYALEPYPAARLAGLAREYGALRVVFHTSDGLAITGLVRDPPSPERPWLVAFAGNGGAQVASALALFAAVDPEHSFGWAAFPYRGFDSAPGTPSFPKLHDDARELVAYLGANHGASRSRIHVIGFSLGTEVAIHLVTESRVHQPFASLVLLAPFVTPYCQLEPGHVHRSLPAHDCVNPRARLGRIHIPTLIVHGADDADHPLAEAHHAADGIALASLVIVPHGTHVDALRSPIATSAVARFLADPLEHAGHAGTAASISPPARRRAARSARTQAMRGPARD